MRKKKKDSCYKCWASVETDSAAVFFFHPSVAYNKDIMSGDLAAITLSWAQNDTEDGRTGENKEPAPWWHHEATVPALIAKPRFLGVQDEPLLVIFSVTYRGTRVLNWYNISLLNIFQTILSRHRKSCILSHLCLFWGDIITIDIEVMLWLLR